MAHIAEDLAHLQEKLLHQRLATNRQVLMAESARHTLQDNTPGQEVSSDGAHPDHVRYHQMMLRREELLARLQLKNSSGVHQTQSLPNLHTSSQLYQPTAGSDEVVPSQQVTKKTGLLLKKSQGTETDPPYHDSHEPRAHQELSHLPPIGQLQRVMPSTTLSMQPAGLFYPSYMVLSPTASEPDRATSAHKSGNSSPMAMAMAEYFDMLMLQNAQMHQAFLQHMLLSSINSQNVKQSEPTAPIVIEQPSPPQLITLPDIQRKAKRRPIHHHHHYQIADSEQKRAVHVKHVQLVDRQNPQGDSYYHSERDDTVSKPPSHQVRKRVRLPPSQPSVKPMVKPGRTHPFPGPWALRKLRHIFYAAWFISFLRNAVKKRKEKPGNSFLFGIRLKEAIAAAHRIYLNSDGNIFPLLRDVVSEGASDLSQAFSGNQKSTQQLIFILDNLVYNITDIMPLTGVLGTSSKSTLREMLRGGQQYPEGYFWEVEKEMLDLSKDSEIREVNIDQARMLLIGILVSRSLITTLLMKPLDYGLSTTVLNEIAESNLRLLCSILLYCIRKSSVASNSRMMPLPIEIAQHLYTDKELEPLLDKLRPSITYCSDLLIEWSKEYASRIMEPNDKAYNLLAR